MSTLLEITGNDIAALKDDDLRTLIGLLCEADFRSDGLPTKGITWGGHQDAKDGGIDVAVHNTVSPPARSYVPRSNTGFQVKKLDMPWGRIQEEMRPKNMLRPSIRALIKNKGAYVIVSSGDSVTDAALSKRKNAMREAVKDEDNREDLHLDFLDRGRIATWVRSYPSLVAWVRGKIGNPIKGWRPYDNWGNAPVELEEEYLLDDGLRLRDLENPSDKGQSVADGLGGIRATLASPGTSVRLIGLSGVGKTRFVQALFDSRIGEHALNSSQAIYADMSGHPEPDPVALANQLINDKSRTVLIVDNCPPDLHRRLTQACSKPNNSTTSVITVEYDVRGDIPEEQTSIFQLEPSSNELIEKLVTNRFPNIGQVDARTIAEFSGGNARVAIVLANTVRYGETLSGFRSEELFERLFYQRHAPNESLLVSAQACALVYSFQGDDATSEASELRFLGTLVEKTGEELYRDVAALKRRELVQSRGVWRAVLPHAIANKLAIQALEDIPKETLVKGFLKRSSKRLIKSFTHRLGYLHDSETAVAIVKAWLEPKGWIGKSIHNLSNFSADVFKNIAPVSPEATLLAIERAVNGSEGAIAFRENAHHEVIVQLLRHLAYDPKLFERSINLIVRFALTENQNILHVPPLEVLKSLFYLCLSGTHASVEARATIIWDLLDSDKVAMHELGLPLLEAALETEHFSSSQKSEFGARSRNDGYDPKTKEDIDHWFDSFIKICTDLALLNHPLAERARKLLANKLRGLWTNGRVYATIERTTERLLKQSAWNDGWMAVQTIIRYDSKGFDKKTRERLLSLEKQLKPQDLLEKARAFALSDRHRSFDPEGDFNEDESASARHKRMNEATREIGAEVARNPDVLRELLPALVSTSNSRLHNFGQGLSGGCADKVELFGTLRSAFEKTPRDQRQFNVILGFLSHSARADSAFYNKALDELIDDEVMAEWFLDFQTTSTIDQRGVKRLHKALDLGKVPIHTYQNLVWGRNHESINDEDLASILEKILTKDGGTSVAAKILHMRFGDNNEESSEYNEVLIDTARKTLMMHPFDQRRHQHENEDYALANIAARSLGGSDGTVVANVFVKRIADAIFTREAYTFGYIQLLNKLAEMQPKIFLDEFLGREDAKQAQLERLFFRSFERYTNPMTKIPDDTIIAWCEENPSSRYVIAITVVDAFNKSGKPGKYEWRPIVNAILRKAPQPEKIVEQLGWMLRPLTWSGSLADILEERAVLLIDLYEHENAVIASWAKKYYKRLKTETASERKSEQERDRNRNETFE